MSPSSKLATFRFVVDLTNALEFGAKADTEEARARKAMAEA